jgi:hypothetical protein
MIRWLETHMLPCTYKQLFGIDCPACGFQRSFIELLKGDWKESFFLYPPTVPILLTAAFLLFSLVFRVKNYALIRKYMLISVVAIVFVSYGIKMFRLIVFHSVS